MQTRESALKSHLAQAIDQFLEQLERTVTSSAHLDMDHVVSDKKRLINGLLHPLAEDFGSLATDWRNDQLRTLVREAGEHLLELSCELENRHDRLEAKRVDRQCTGKPIQPASNGKGQVGLPR